MTGRRLALVVANDQYDDPALRALASPAADAEALAEVLGDLELGGFEVDVLSNERSWVVAEHIEGLLGDRKPSDLVLLHFSCHGLKDETGELYLAATNTRPRRLVATAVDAAVVNRLMRRSRAQRVVLILDCCYGGAFERGVVTRAGEDVHVGEQFSPGDSLDSGRGRVVITASSAMEYAFEGEKLATGEPSASIFTSALVDGIRSGAADRDQDGRVSLDELYDFVHDTVRSTNPNQTPSRWEFGVQGDLLIARNPRRRIVPSALDRDLVGRAEDASSGIRLTALDELVGIARGRDLGSAASAVGLLRRMADDDSKRVSTAAAAAVGELAPVLETDRVDLGHLTVGRAASATLRVDGPPLALASALTSSTPDVTASMNGSLLRVDAKPVEPGPLDATVSLFGPAGEARLSVSAEASADVPDDDQTQRREEPVQPSEDDRGGVVGLHTAIPLALLGALAMALTVLDRTTEVEFEGGTSLFAAYADLPGTTVAFLIPSILAAGAGVALSWRRHQPIMLGVIAGVAAWNTGFWLKMTAQGIDKFDVTTTLAGTLTTSLWARIPAAALLIGVLYLAYGGSGARGLTRQRGVLPWALALIVVASATIPLIELVSRGRSQSYARVSVEVIGMIAICLPVVLLALSPRRRRFALTTVIVFACVTASRDVWQILIGEESSHFTATVTGAMIPMACCLIAQARHAPAVGVPPRAPEPPGQATLAAP